MNVKTIANGILRAIAILLGVFLLGAFLYAIQSVIVYVIIAAVLSLVTRPFVIFLKNKARIPNTIAVVVAMVLMLACLAGIIGLFIPLILEQGESLSLLQIDGLQANIQNVFNQITAYFSSKGINVLETLKNVDFTKQFKEIPNLLNSVLGALGSISVGLFSVLFISFFFNIVFNLI